MRLLEEILNEMMLSESVTVNDVDSAIDNHERIIINYHTKGEDKNTGARVIEVYAYGLTKAGNECIRAFQPFGDTTTKVPSWKFFRLDRISAWKPTGQIFDRPADFFYKGLGDFNPNGDETMSMVYKIAQFGSNTTANSEIPDNGPKLKAKNDGEVFKTDTEYGMERLKRQLDNPIKLSDIKTKNGFKDLTEPQGAQNGPKLKADTKPKDDVYKTDTERGLANLKKQLENPKYIDSLRDKKDDIRQLRDKLGDTSKPIPYEDLKQRLMPQEKGKEEEKDDIYKTDTERNMANLKKQLDNPRYVDLTKVPRR